MCRLKTAQLTILTAVLMGSTTLSPSLSAGEEEVLVGWRGGTSTNYSTLAGDAFPATWIGTFRYLTNLQTFIEPTNLFAGTIGLNSAYWFDGFDVTGDSLDVNFETGAPRQGGADVPTSYMANSPDPSNDYHHQLFGGGGTPLQLTGDAAFGLNMTTFNWTNTLVSPNINFTETASGQILNKLTVSMDVYLNRTPDETNYVKAAVTIGSSVPLQQHNNGGDGFSIVFVEDTFNNPPGSPNSAYYLEYYYRGSPVGFGILHSAGDGPIDLEVVISDAGGDGNPWDGAGGTSFAITVNGQPVVPSWSTTFANDSVGCTNNFITLEGGAELVDGPSSARHIFDNLTMFSTQLPDRLDMAELNGDGVDDKVQILGGASGPAILAASYTGCSPLNFGTPVLNSVQTPTPTLQASDQDWSFGDFDGDGIDDPLFTIEGSLVGHANGSLQWGGFVSAGVPGIAVDQGDAINWVGYHAFGEAGDDSMLGDCDGDGIVDRIIYREIINTVFIDYSAGPATWGDGTADVSLALGLPRDKLTVSDFNGDGLTDLVLHGRVNAGNPALQDVFVYYNDGMDFSTINQAEPDVPGIWGGGDGVLFANFDPTPPRITDWAALPGSPLAFTLSWDSFLSCLYAVECTTNLSSSTWTPIGTVDGTGGVVTFTNSPAVDDDAYYRLRIDTIQFVNP